MPDVSAAGQLIADDAYSSRNNQSQLDISQIDEIARQVKQSSQSNNHQASSSSRRYDSDDDDDDDDDDGLAWMPSPVHRGADPSRESLAAFPLSTQFNSARRHDAALHPDHNITTPTRRRQSSLSQSQDALDKRKLRIMWWRSALINCLFILAWYCFSTIISLYNKWMFSSDHFDFPYPLFVTSIHMLVQWCLAALTLTLVPAWRSRHRPSAHEYGTKVAPCGMATGLDIGFSNLSLRLITLSFYTMCKSSSLAFVLMFAFLFRLEKPSIRLIGIILIITAGVILMVSSETQFNFLGMILVLSASALGGLRWSLTQILLDKESMGMSNPVATIYWLAPVMGVTLATVSLVIDGWITIFRDERFFGSFGQTLWTTAAILFPGVLAFSMNVTEFGLIKRTSVVTLSVAGIFKEVAVIFLSTLIFNDQLTPINISGLAVTIFGIILYNYLKYKQYTSGQVGKHGEPIQKDDHDFVPLAHHSTDASDHERTSVIFDGEYEHHLTKESEEAKREQHRDDAIPLLDQRLSKDDYLRSLERDERDAIDALDEAISNHQRAKDDGPLRP